MKDGKGAFGISAVTKKSDSSEQEVVKAITDKTDNMANQQEVINDRGTTGGDGGDLANSSSIASSAAQSKTVATSRIATSRSSGGGGGPNSSGSNNQEAVINGGGTEASGNNEKPGVRAGSNIHNNQSECSSKTAALWNNQGIYSTNRCCYAAADATVIEGKTWCTSLKLNDECMHHMQCESTYCKEAGTAAGVCAAKPSTQPPITGKVIKLHHNIVATTGKSLRTTDIKISAYDQYGDKITSGISTTDPERFTQLVLTKDTTISKIIITNRVNNFLDRINGCRLVVTNAAGEITLRTDVISGAQATYTFTSSSDLPKQAAGTPVPFAYGPLECASKRSALWNDKGGGPDRERCCPTDNWQNHLSKGWCINLPNTSECNSSFQCTSGFCSNPDTPNGRCLPKQAAGTPVPFAQRAFGCESGMAGLWNDKGGGPKGTRCCPTANSNNIGQKAWCTNLPNTSECNSNSQCTSGFCSNPDTPNGKCQ